MHNALWFKNPIKHNISFDPHNIAKKRVLKMKERLVREADLCKCI